jgi:hypothetical protein
MADDGAKGIQQIIDNLAIKDPAGAALSANIQEKLKQLGVGPITRNAIAGAMGALVSVVLVIVGLLIGVVVSIGAPLVTIFLRVLTKTRTETVKEQVEISAAVLSEFLATEIDPAHLKMGKSKDETIAAAQAIGKAMLDRLTTEFVPQGKVTPESGEAAAQTFVGYGVNFAVQNTMISTLADAISFHLLEDFRELGVEVAQNMGLGRLVRQALRPLIRNSIEQPYDRALKARYRQDQIADDSYVKAWFRGAIDETELRSQLAQKGYSERDIDLMIFELAERLPDKDLLAMLRYGLISEDTVIQKMVARGIIEPQARDTLTAQKLTRQDDQWSAYLGVIINQATHRRLPLDEFNKLLDRFPYLDEEKQIIREQVGQELEIPTSFLTWSEVVTAFENGIIDLDYVDNWLVREGYGPDDTDNKEFLLLVKFNAFADKQALQAAKASGATKGLTVKNLNPQ